ncbi:hypothetical protein HYV43_00015 [Candidatus Micrarchaeota archaeon]|nr:hypothetical protein [Candidatus Micrarchaeota archaeon]
MTLFFHLKAQTEQMFRETAMKKYGYSKGALKSALEEAIEDWLRKHDAHPVEEKENANPNEKNKKNENNPEKQQNTKEK